MAKRSLIVVAPRAASASVPKFGFKHASRLSDKSAIQQVFSTGKKLGARELSLFFCQNTLTHPRICISISKKQVADAYLRNRIKRTIRESFRLNQHTLPFCDMVIVVYKSLSLLDKQQLREKIELLWPRLNKFLKKA